MWNLKEFESVYGRYKKSGLRVKDFCMNECISENKFCYRQKRLKKQQKIGIKQLQSRILLP
jgi:hypothetical protein